MYLHTINGGSQDYKFWNAYFFSPWMFLFSLNACQDRLTFRRIIVKNNAKKRRLYEAFIETLPLLTSLEVSRLPLSSSVKKLQCAFTIKTFDSHISFLSTALWENEGCRRAVHQGVQWFTADYCSGDKTLYMLWSFFILYSNGAFIKTESLIFWC